MRLEESTFVLYAAKYYSNPSCHSLEEFNQDLKRFQYVRKLLKRYKNDKTLKERLILNHIIVIYNCFGYSATPMLFLKLEGLHDLLKPFLAHLSLLPEIVSYEDKTIDTSSIIEDSNIAEILGKRPNA